MRVLVRALLGLVAELGLHRLYRLAAGNGLARDRVVVAEHAEADLCLHQLERADVAVDVTRQVAGLGDRNSGPP